MHRTFKMKAAAICALALASAPALAIPPPSFGFPEAPNDTALAVSFPQTSGAAIVVTEAESFGIAIPAQMPSLGARTAQYRSLAEYDGSYLVIMVDPDASYPQDPTKRFYLHWLQANLTQGSAQNASFGRPLVNGSTPSAPVVPYLRPSPPTNSSAHRYIVYAFQQPSDFQLPQQWTGLGANNRSSFNLTNFLGETNLGTPAAAEYFYVSNQSAVDPTFTAAPGGTYPGGNGMAVTSGDPYKSAASSTSSSQGGAAMITGAGALLGAGLIGMAAML